MSKLAQKMQDQVKGNSNNLLENSVERTREEALNRGKRAVEGDKVVSLENGVVELVNENQNEIEIYFDNGHGLAIQFPFGPTGYSVKVSPNQKVKKGQVLVQFGPEMENTAHVYSFTPDMIKVLSESRFRIK